MTFRKTMFLLYD